MISMSRLAPSRIKKLVVLAAVLVFVPLSGSGSKQQVGASTNGRIAYTSPDTSSYLQIHTVNTDGTDDEQLTTDAYAHWYPSYSPDGTKIAFVGQLPPSGDDQIIVMNADGTNQVTITTAANTVNETPAWSPDGTKIAYARGPDDYSTPYVLYISNADGTNPTAVTDGTSYSVSPSWNADGSKLAYTCGGQICSISKDGTNNTVLTSGSSSHTSPSFSPDGTQIAYINIATGYVQTIIVMNADGSSPHTINTGGTSNDHVSWSPDGTKLVYDDQDTTQGITRIYYINLDGTGRTVVSPDNQYAIVPTWQPIPTIDVDGDGIASSIEAAAPNNGDANGDGIADKNQANVSSFVNPVTNNYVSVQSNCTTNSTVSAMAVPGSYKDAAFGYPAGLLNFSLTCGAPGTTATVTQYFYGLPASATMVLRKYNNTTHTYATVPGATISTITLGGKIAARATYQITDGSSIDQDAARNGVIIDPVGLALPSVGAPNTGLGGSVVLPWLSAAPSL
jgi:Tol biopolymer transport system component